MMGADSVEYHEHTVAGRSDDPVAASVEYYASRGETPMSWGGSGCVLLGLEGEVDLSDYRAVFGVGGAHDPRNGRRLVGCLRPGLELVISPHKSVAELGVIGRAEDMHEIVDAERDATLDYLDRLVAERGGRRGRTQTRVGTGGLIWATSRHATTRAGDPQRSTITSSSRTPCSCLTLVAVGRVPTPRCCETTCTRRRPSGAWLAPPRRSSSDTGSWPTRGLPDGSGDGRSRGSQPRSASCTRPARLRSALRSGLTPPTERALLPREPPGPQGTGSRRGLVGKVASRAD